MKRFTETTKWDDPWYRNLSPAAKLLWAYLTDKCNCVGLIELDRASAAFHIGCDVNESHLTELESRLQRLPNGKLFIPKFIRFQYGELSVNCPAHKPVFRAIHQFELTRTVIGYQYPMATLSAEVVDYQQNQYPSDRVAIPYRKGKEPDRNQIGNGKEPESLYAETQKLKTLVNSLLNRDDDDHWTKIEEEALCKVAKRKSFESEFETLRAYRNKLPEAKKQYFPQTAGSLLEKWGATLDRARNFKEPTCF